MNSKTLLITLIATFLIYNSAAIMGMISKIKVFKLGNQSSYIGAVAADKGAITVYSGEWLGIGQKGENKPNTGMVPFLTSDQIQALQLHFPYR